MQAKLEEKPEGMTAERETKILERAIKEWGTNNTIVLVIEDLSELSAWLSKYLRCGDNSAVLDAVSHEIARTNILLNTLELIFGDDPEREIKILESIERRVKADD